MGASRGGRDNTRSEPRRTAINPAPAIQPPLVTLIEVAPRDGLQSESVTLYVPTRVELVSRMEEAGSKRIEAVSFVHPGVVPQMAQAEAVLEALGPSPRGVSYIGLVLNERGLVRALTTDVDEVNFSVAASDGYNQHNQSASVADTMSVLDDMIPAGNAAGRRTTLTISVAFGDPYDGVVEPNRVVELAGRALGVGVDEIAVGDTIGVATPRSVDAVVEALSQVMAPPELRCHFHNTRNSGLANLYAAVQVGVTMFDTSVGGIGGSPFAPGAGGNIATEDAAFFLERMSMDHELDLGSVVATGRWLGERLGYQLPAALQRVPAWP